MEKLNVLPHKILIGTHHKTGTVWLQSIFEEICRQFSLKFHVCSKNTVPDTTSDVILNHHSRFTPELLSLQYRGIHIIRDPRDVIISGCFYHQKSQEKWLYRPLERLQGQTYHDKINSLKTTDEQLLFEMEMIGRVTNNDMVNWNYTNPLFYELKYESLIKDTDLVIFRDLISFLGFSDELLSILLEIVRKNSILSSRVYNNAHVRSGEIQQWKNYFNPLLKQRFLELFGDSLIQLGYEKDDNWES